MPNLIATGTSSGLVRSRRTEAESRYPQLTLHPEQGFEALKQLCATTSLHWNFLLGARDVPKTQRSYDELISQSAPAATSSSASSKPSTASVFPLDLKTQTSVTKFALDVRQKLTSQNDKIDVLFLCAGVWLNHRDQSGQYGQDFVINYLSEILLLDLLKDLLSESVRIVLVTSSLHRKLQSADDLESILRGEDLSKYSGPQSYGATKFCQMMLAHRLAQTLPHSQQVVTVSPGFVPATNLGVDDGLLKYVVRRYLLPWAPFATTLHDGGEAILRALTMKDLPASLHPDSALYLGQDGKAAEPHSATLNKDLQTYWVAQGLEGVARFWEAAVGECQ